MQNNSIIINMIVFDTEDGLQIQLTDDMAGDLNDFHYVDTDTVLYEYNGDTYIENAGQREKIYSSSVPLNYSELERERQKTFYEASFGRKIELINANILNMVPCTEREMTEQEELDALMRLELYHPMDTACAGRQRLQR